MRRLLHFASSLMLTGALAVPAVADFAGGRQDSSPFIYGVTRPSVVVPTAPAQSPAAPFIYGITRPTATADLGGDMKLCGSSNLEDSIAACGRLIQGTDQKTRTSPDFAPVYYRRGAAFFFRKDYDRAIS